MLITGSSCTAQTAKNEKLVEALNNSELVIRGTLIRVGQTDYRLDYYDYHEQDSHAEFLNAKGYGGGGPSWLGIVYGAIKLADPTILDNIRFDDESDGLAIWSTDKESLIKIGRLISMVKTDERLLLQAIQVAEQNGQME